MACYCTQCGKEMDPNAAICVSCGFAKGSGKNYCGNCGNQVDPNAAVCVKCGVALANTNAGNTAPGLVGTSDKSKMAAGLFAIFLGHLGIHHFYLGNTNKGVLCIVLTVVAAILCFFAIGVFAFIGLWIWHIIEGVKILTDKNATDAEGKLLQ